jgi:hypothetical protein
MENPSLQIGDNNWAAKDGSILGYNIIQDNYLPQPIDFTRASTATRVNESGLIESVATGVPRIDYTSGFGKLLLEPQRTNVRTYSEDIIVSNLYGANNSTLTSVSITNPQNTSSANLLKLNSGANTGNNTDGFSFGSGITLTNSTKYTQSIFVKAFGTNTFRIRSNVSGLVADFTLSGNGTAPTILGVLQGATIELMTNGWYRCTWTFTTTTSVPGNRADAWTLKTGVANGTDGIYIWGAQIELGSYATSYIPTTSTAVTRVADTAYKTGISSLIGQTEGTLFVEVNLTTLQGAVARTFIDIGSASNRVFLGFTSLASNTIRLQIDTALGQRVDFRAVVSSTGTIKVAAAYKDGDCALYVNGVAGTLLANNSISFTAISNLFLGQTLSSTAILGDGISQALLFKTRLTNAELATLTTL